jgi:hypothetical protein
VLARAHGETITEVATAMVVFVAREREGEPVDGDAVALLVQQAMNEISM